MNWKLLWFCISQGHRVVVLPLSMNRKKITSSGNQTAIEAMHRIKQSAVDMKLAFTEKGIWRSLPI